MAVVVGLKDAHYGEVVGAFLQDSGKGRRPSLSDVREWVTKRLGRHKAPTHVFWLGEGRVPATVPLTGSGKVRKFELAKLGSEIIAEEGKKLSKL